MPDKNQLHLRSPYQYLNFNLELQIKWILKRSKHF